MMLFFGWVVTAQTQAEYQQQLQHTIQVKQVQLKKVNTEKIRTQQQLHKKAVDEKNLKKQIDDLNKKLEAKRDAEAQATLADAQPKPQPVTYAQPVAQPTYTYQAPIAKVVSGCGDNSYANYIYMHESGCRLNAVNSGGCVGIGQACPGSKLYAVCPDLNYACQNAFFTSYSAKYGGWAGAYNFWVRNSWW